MTVGVLFSSPAHWESGSAPALCIFVRNYFDVAAACGRRAADAAMAELRLRAQAALGDERIDVECDGAHLRISPDSGSGLTELRGRSEALLVALGRDPAVIDGDSILLALSVANEDAPAPPDGCYLLASESARCTFLSLMKDAVSAFEAMNDGRLALAFQPVRAADGEDLLYWEALARVVPADSRREVVSPGQFVPAIEALGLSRLFDRFVVLKTIETLRANPCGRIGCNVSAQSVVDDEYWVSVLDELAAAPEVAARLVIEITETALLADMEVAQRLVARLKHLGCQVALDDFGAGHSSIAQSLALRPDIIKIDRLFLREAVGQVFGGELLVGLVDLCNCLAGQVVVEGIEDERDLVFAHRAGARWVQGYHVAAPSIARPFAQAEAQLDLTARQASYGGGLHL
ncbi:EAL domain-containing protein [Bosea sp. MMO-172]|uniref:EAL domain-containing protein n=1 Tax=Bosea sp. MMO-172 TaxID=3127885 RepID=UPI003017FB39